MKFADLILFRGVPPVLRRTYYWIIWPSIIAVVITAAYLPLSKHFGWPRSGWFRLIPIAIGSTPMCIFIPIGYWVMRGIRRDWHEAAGRLCTHCGYNVSTLPPAGTCPECGKQFDINKDASIWAQSEFIRARSGTS